MKISKKIFIKLSVLSIILVICFFSLWLDSRAKAAVILPGETMNLHVKMEVSKDGSTWYNYSGTDYSGNQTLTASPGDTIQIRVKVWNDGNGLALNVTGASSVTNPTYITSVSVINANLDGLDAISYVGDFFSGSGEATLSQVAAGTTEATSQQGLFSVTLASNIPAGETVVLGTVTISNYASPDAANNPFIKVARAEGLGNNSVIRIVVNPVSTQSASTQEDLPQTGSSVSNSSIVLLALGLLAIVFSISILVFRINRRKKDFK